MRTHSLKCTEQKSHMNTNYRAAAAAKKNVGIQMYKSSRRNIIIGIIYNYRKQ